MNDNRPTRPVMYLANARPALPHPCFCGRDQVIVDRDIRGAKRGPYFVICTYCGATGPELPTFDLAVTAWNRATVLYSADSDPLILS